MLNFKSILCLNGRLPNKTWFAKQQNVPIIAADGASNKLIAQGIVPDFIIGDLDSIEKKHFTSKYNIIMVDNQDTTDFEKCLLEMEKKTFFPSLVLGIGGGEVDHTIYNLNCFMRHAKKQPLFFLDIDENHKVKHGIPVFERYEMFGQTGKIISLLPFPEAIVSTHGLKWDLVNAHLSVATIASVRNVVQKELVTICVQSGALLIVIDS